MADPDTTRQSFVHARQRLLRERWVWWAATVVVLIGWDLAEHRLLALRVVPALVLAIDWLGVAVLTCGAVFVISHAIEARIRLAKQLVDQQQAIARASHQLEAAQTTARTIAHTINQPLTVLLVSIQLLERPDLPEDAQADIQAVRIQAERVATCVRQLQQLDVYRTIPYADGRPILDLAQPDVDSRNIYR